MQNIFVCLAFPDKLCQTSLFQTVNAGPEESLFQSEFLRTRIYRYPGFSFFLSDVLQILTAAKDSAFVSNSAIQPLFLSSRNTARTFRNHGLHAHGHFPDILGNTGDFRRFPCFVHRKLRRGNRNVGKKISLEQLPILDDSSHSRSLLGLLSNLVFTVSSLSLVTVIMLTPAQCRIDLPSRLRQPGISRLPRPQLHAQHPPRCVCGNSSSGCPAPDNHHRQ